MTRCKGTIVYVGGFEMPDKNAAAHRVLNNSKIFTELGYKVVFCGIDHEIKSNADEAIVFDNFESYPLKYPNSNKEWFKSQISFEDIKNVLQKYTDIKYVIGYNMHALPLRNLEIWSKSKKIKVLLDVTEWYPNKFSLKPQKFIRWIDTNLTMRLYQKKVDGMIVISSYLQNYYKNYVKNIIVIPPLIDKCDDKWAQEKEYRGDIVEFTYSGSAANSKTMVKDKIDVIINAMVNVPSKYSFHFSIVGMSYEDCIKLFPNIKEKLKILGDKVTFFGRVSHEESIKILKRSDYCVFFRDNNRQNIAGFPTKFVECVTIGNGLIVNEFSDLKDYFPLENSFLLDGITNKDISEALIKCIRNGQINKNPQDIFDYHSYIDNFNLFIKKLDE